MKLTSHRETFAAVEFTEKYVRYIEVATNVKGEKTVSYISELPLQWDNGQVLMSQGVGKHLKRLVSKRSAAAYKKRKDRGSTLVVVVPDEVAAGNIAQVDASEPKESIKSGFENNIRKVVPVTGEHVVDFDIAPEADQAFIFAVRAELVRKIVELFSELSFNVERIEVRSHALRSVIDQDASVLLIDGKETTAAMSVWDRGNLRFLSSVKFDAEEVREAKKNKRLSETVFAGFFSELTKLSGFFTGEYRVLWTGSLTFEALIEGRIRKAVGGRQIERFDVSRHFVYWPKDVLPDVYVGLIGAVLTHYLSSDFTMLPRDTEVIATKYFKKNLLDFYSTSFRNIALGVLAAGLLFYGGSVLFSSNLTGQRDRLEAEAKDLPAIREVEKINNDINYAVGFVSSGRKWNEDIDYIFSVKDVNTYTHLSVSGERTTMILRGIAPTREDLLNLQSKLGQRFKSAVPRPESFVKSADLDFIVDITP